MTQPAEKEENTDNSALLPKAQSAPRPGIRRSSQVWLLLALGALIVGAMVGAIWPPNAGQEASLEKDNVAALSGTATPIIPPSPGRVDLAQSSPPSPTLAMAQAAPPSVTTIPTQTTMPTEASTLLFTIPGGENGISVWSGTQGLYGIGAASDGTFWVGDFHKAGDSIDDGGRLLHYGHDGTQLGTLKPDLGVGGGLEFVHDVECWGSDIWAIIQGKVVRLSEDGRILAEYQDTGMFGPPGGNNSALLMGASGEPLLSWDTADTRVLQVADSAGNIATPNPTPSTTIALTSTLPYPGRGLTYQARPAVSTIPYSREGIVQAGSITITATMEHRLSGLHIFHVNSDNSFYALAEETLDNPVGVQETVLHYSLDGRLLEHARIPLRARYIDVIRRLAVAADGTVYALVDAGESARAGFEVRKVNFFPATMALPDSSGSGAAQATVSPAPAATAPPIEAIYICTILYTEGLRYDEGPPRGDDNVHGFGQSASGNFHIGGPSGLFEYTPTGVRVTAFGCCVPEDNGQWGTLYFMAMRGNDLWLLVGQAAHAGVAHWSITGKDVDVTIRYPLPELIDNMDVSELLIKGELVLTLDTQGEALLSWNSPDTRVARLTDAADNPVPFKTGPGGKTMLTSESWYPGPDPSVRYTARPADPGNSPVGYITAGSKKITVTLDAPLVGLHIMNVAGDGSFYALAVQETGSPPVQFGTVLHYAADGSFLGHTAASGFGPYTSLMRRLAVGNDDKLYYMVSQHDGWDLKQPVFVAASNPLPTPTPTSVHTYGTQGAPAPPTPTPATVDDLEAQSVAIAEVDVAAMDNRNREFDGLIVRRWLKSEDARSSYLNLWESPAVHDRISTGSGHYILFLRHKLENYWCQQTEDFYEVVGETHGIFQITGNKIGWAGLPQYGGSTLDGFISTLRPLIPTPTVTPAPAAWPDRLAQQVNSADMIAEVVVEDEGPGGTQTVVFSARVLKWLKKPGTVTKDEIVFAAHKCELGRMRLARNGERAILFLTTSTTRYPNGWSDGTFLTGGPAGIYGIRDGVIFLGGYAGYQGSSPDELEAAIRAALAQPGTPEPGLMQRYQDP